MKKSHQFLLFAFLTPILFTQCAAVKHQKMAEQNKETVRLWFEEGWNKNRNEELITTCFSENWSDGNPLRPDQIEGFEGMKQLIRSYRDAFPDSHFTITHLFADKDNVAIRYEVTATHQGEMFGIEPTGKEFSSTGIVLYEMEKGKIKISWQELDLVGIMNQLKN
jgi:predicted ester cyclase